MLDDKKTYRKTRQDLLKIEIQLSLFVQNLEYNGFVYNILNKGNNYVR